jgi:hypothetical protein
MASGCFIRFWCHSSTAAGCAIAQIFECPHGSPTPPKCDGAAIRNIIRIDMYRVPPNQPPAPLAAALQDPRMVQMALKMMNQNPHLLPPMQDPRIMQQAMQMMQQQQAMQLSGSMAALSVRDAQAARKQASNKSRQELQQAASQDRRQRREERRSRKEKKGKKKGKARSDEDEEFDFAKSTKVYDMWNNMLISMLEMVARIRPKDALAVEMVLKVIRGFANETENVELRKEPLHLYHKHLLPHYKLIQDRDPALFDPKLKALGDLDKLNIDKHWPTLTEKQQESLWKSIELLFLMAVQIKNAKSTMLNLIEIALTDAEDPDNDVDGDGGFAKVLGGVLGKGAGGPNPMAAVIGDGPTDIQSLMDRLPEEMRQQVGGIVAEVQKTENGQAAPALDDEGDLFGMSSDGLLALLRSQTTVPEVKK